jgi:excisionase family DNA binding protein
MDGATTEYAVDGISDIEVEETDSLLTTSETASLLHVHINTVRRWSNMGVLKSFRIGPRGDRRFLKEDIDKFLRE